MTDAETVAVTALREAASALRKGSESEGAEGELPENAKPALAGEIAHVLDGMVRLLRTVDLDPAPTTQAGHNLHAVLEHLTAGSTLARTVGRDSPSTPPGAP
ncbi:hypothetical protein LQ327_04190 [Actinomycetospora endophytica]|uniref:Uncharacterized protein n=1 Tax=Actinomycetospora endophytica TaxID=2291215 RepID=A0ABS8P2X9_9PSEU|nr:hypothetical protein [Actinomycetospora endophytica]MCD2192588.1 hypothetical protein [Actinomycetospora endophytica]